ncbi:hypothetical protein Psfp_02415 [Pelotomaculum sp. FP]|nr:hypothetical protein Psfp_02415 [Pelotomaculum sp. FP]
MEAGGRFLEAGGRFLEAGGRFLEAGGRFFCFLFSKKKEAKEPSPCFLFFIYLIITLSEDCALGAALLS